MFTLNDFYILRAIIDKNDKDKGIVKFKGTTKKEIQEKTKLSLPKITNALTDFINQGYVDYGLKIKQSKTYIVTQKGNEELLKAGGKLKDE